MFIYIGTYTIPKHYCKINLFVFHMSCMCLHVYKNNFSVFSYATSRIHKRVLVNDALKLKTKSIFMIDFKSDSAESIRVY